MRVKINLDKLVNWKWTCIFDDLDIIICWNNCFIFYDPKAHFSNIDRDF